MPLNQRNTRVFHRKLYAGELVSITLLKRNDDQQQGTVRSLVLYQSRRSRIIKTGEPIQGDETGNYSSTWHIPRVELDRVGVAYINAADRIVERSPLGEIRYWMPQSNTIITTLLFENMVDIDVVSVNPPKEP